MKILAKDKRSNLFVKSVRMRGNNIYLLLLKGRSQPGNPYCWERLSTVDLLVKVACFVKMKKIFSL